MQLKLIVLCSAFALSGCYSMQGSERVLNRDGRLTTEVPTGSIFRNDFERNYKQRASGEQVSDEQANLVLLSGFGHIYSYCDSYFDTMALQQRRSKIGRDAIAPISALITGVIAFQSFESNPGRKEDLLAALGLATSATSSYLDIYDQHLLFGADNIGSVETLTRNALTEHSKRVLSFDNMTFDAATRHLLDNQAICSPQHILTLTREAIREGKVVARTKADPEANGLKGMSEENSDDPNASVTTSIDNGSGT